MVTNTGLIPGTDGFEREVQRVYSATFTQGGIYCKYCGVLLTYKRIDRRCDARTGPDGNYVHPSNHSIDATEANRPAETKHVEWFMPVEEFKLILRQLEEAARNLTFGLADGYIANDEDDSGIALTEDDVDEIESWVARNSDWVNGHYRNPAVIRACVMEVALGGGLYRDPTGAALPLKYAVIDRINSGRGYELDNMRVILDGLNGLNSNYKDDSSLPPPHRVLACLRSTITKKTASLPPKTATITKTASLPSKTATITKTASLPSPPNWRSSARSRRQSCQDVGDGTDSDASASSISDNDLEWRSSEAETTSDEKYEADEADVESEADEPTKTTRTKLPAIKKSNRSKTASTHSSKTASNPSSSSSPPKRKWGFSEDELTYVTADGVDLSAYIRLDHEPDWEELKQLTAKKRANQVQRSRERRAAIDLAIRKKRLPAYNRRANRKTDNKDMNFGTYPRPPRSHPRGQPTPRGTIVPLARA